MIRASNFTRCGNEEITAADRLIVESPTNTGLIVIKALAADPGLLA